MGNSIQWEVLDGHIAAVKSEGLIFGDLQSALDLMADARHNYQCDALLVEAKSVNPDFFELKTGIAGEILQKFTNYQMRLAVVGDCNPEESYSLSCFILESNKGKTVCFVPTEQEALVFLNQ